MLAFDGLCGEQHVAWERGRSTNSNRIDLPVVSVAALMILLFFSTPRAAQPVPASKPVCAGGRNRFRAYHALGWCLQGLEHSPFCWQSCRFLRAPSSLRAQTVADGNRGMIQRHLMKKKAFVANLVSVFFLAGLYFPTLYAAHPTSVHRHRLGLSQRRPLYSRDLGISICTMVLNGFSSAFCRHMPLMVVGAVAGTAGATLI